MTTDKICKADLPKSLQKPMTIETLEIDCQTYYC